MAKVKSVGYDPAEVWGDVFNLAHDLIIPALVFCAGLTLLVLEDHAAAGDNIGIALLMFILGLALLLLGVVGLGIMLVQHMRYALKKTKKGTKPKHFITTKAGSHFYWAIAIGSLLGLMLAIISADENMFSFFDAILIIFVVVHFLYSKNKRKSRRHTRS